ncbi:hypothetical protein DMN91_001411 [Ooceraea biroi]|uniref:Dehydrogenase/reductase SDR family member n=2 Tax=Ooceraea biroi TaxID=2015173 RepID=A0A026WX44_OOCBI|nr:farnesol dehydrogenase isoform X2 [Ooceraea biroi]EZA60597.1 Dehydrogenase/reductase SDR family member [Ooceraea biroi]RLU27607.1 hypothetical protein DMN91_001411 [Ooceraea biroi]
MDRWIGRTAVVTGAASGIGEAITRALLRKGVNVVALDMQKEKLASLTELVAKKQEDFLGVLRPIHCDISVKKDIDAAFQQIDAYGGVDIMVNNAGVVSYCRVIDSNREEFERLLNINVLAVAVCTNKAVCSMRDRNVEGHIFNINSITGHQMLPNPLSEAEGLNGFNIYPASKQASVCLTNIIRKEITTVKAPIRVTSISPGFVNTDIAKKWKEMQEVLDKMPSLEPDDIADALIYALGTRPEVQITELTVQRTGE